jgi:predicted ATPase
VVSDPIAVASAVAGVFSVTQQSDKSIEQALVDSLKSQRLLLILDNCEHVTAASVKLADGLLK